MSDNLVLELLRAIRGDIAELRADNVELRERMGLLEGQASSISRRLDRLVGDVSQVRRRLDLADAPTA